jgi:hypothetical protein
MPTSTSVDVSKYVDFTYLGFQSNPSLNLLYPFVLKGRDALKNVVKMYLMSQKGDYGRNLSKGGPLFSLIGKALSDANKKLVSDLIRKALAGYVNIVISSIDVSVDSQRKEWIVSIVFSDTYNKFVDSINLAIAV